MPVQTLLQASTYRDSVTLMQVARDLTQLAGVQDAAVVMGTGANKALLREAGLLQPESEAAGPNDLLVAVRAESQSDAEQALERAGQLLARRPASGPGGRRGFRPRSIRSAARAQPAANLALISVPGAHAAAEAWEALHQGLHVLLFSDNVPLEDEVALKRYAVEHGLLLMGPDCGTAILDGVALGFANAVPRGPVGIVSASGTGLQEAACLLARLGVGLSQGIGTGGRDLKEAVGGLMMLEGLRRLQQDPASEVLLLISKPPAASVAERVLTQAGRGDKPTVVCFLGGETELASAVIPARTLQEAAYRTAAQVAGYSGPSLEQALERERAEQRALAGELAARLQAGQRCLRGLYSGGTLAGEALIVLEDSLGAVRSNVPLRPELALPDPARSQGHCLLDLGADEFTVGRPHPMLDHDLRIRRLFQEATDPEVAVILLDIVLGYGAHPDPAAELAPALYRARAQAAQDGRELLVVASVTGTADDPQDLQRQVGALEGAGAVVAPCNAAAARLAGRILEY
ncbi:MAG: acyl-CoA synthetase FdrA [Chloroflexia bacterium]|nr:acyl-CoA synthetase FdrA [Chloroflexia bacterium]